MAHTQQHRAPGTATHQCGSAVGVDVLLTLGGDVTEGIEGGWLEVSGLIQGPIDLHM